MAASRRCSPTYRPRSGSPAPARAASGTSPTSRSARRGERGTRVDKAIEELLAGIDAQHERVWQVRRAVERMEITGYAGDGEVTVKLRGTGQFTQIELDPRWLRRADPEEVGHLVLRAVNDGIRRLGEASRREFEPIIQAASNPG